MNINKMKYDLALAYAKSKLDHALATNTVPEPDVDYIHESEKELYFLTDSFYLAIDIFANYDDSMFPDSIDD